MVAGLPPTNTALPAISGTTTQGQTLTAADGTWSNSPTGYTYQWRRCDSTGSSCTDIADATGSTYLSVYEDAGGTIRVVVTASNSYGSANATSSPTAVVTGLPPSNIGPIPPAISGTAAQGNQLTAAPGLWRNSPTSFTYQWLRCSNTSLSSCVDIGTASPDYTYMLAADDVGYRIRVEVTASNPWGSNYNTSAATAVVQGAPPVNTALPVISGEALPVIGHTLTASNGSWNPVATSYTYQWQHCHYSGSPCTDISGATASTYVVQSGDYGQKIQIVVTAHNAYGIGSATSAQTGLVGRPPLNTGGLPAISGMAREGQTLTASTGSWTESPTSYSYQWRICDGTGSGCFDVSNPSANPNTFSLAIRDIVGATIRVVVTATNAYGSGSATSVQTAVVDTGAPINTALPTITGSPGVGQTLTASNGSWNPAATLPYSYEWQHCSVPGGVCTSISGAYLGTYVPQAADVGSTIRVIVTAWNDYGSGGATSTKTGIVGYPPVNTALPSISGTAQVGQFLTAAHGTWTNSPTGYSYQWRRCDSSGANCENTSTGSSTYSIQDADYQHTIRVIVTASNTYGGTSATSDPTAVVVGNPPVNFVLPAITGSARRGEIVHALSGSWYNSPTSYWYNWYRCDAAGGNCVDTGYIYDNYIIQTADVGGTIRVLVTAYNTYGPGTAVFSPQTGVVT